MSKPAAEERLGRLLAVVPWVASHDGPAIADVCARFGVTERELLADLDLLFLCGIHPFTPDTLIEVDIADGRVWIRFADWFSRPLRLTPPEGLALLSAGTTLLAVPGADQDGALARGVSKLATVLGVGGDDALDVELGPAAPGILEALQEATSGRRKVEIDYYSFGRDGRSTRVVAPWRVFNAQGQWYVNGWCEQARGERLFRVDRISRAQILDQSFVPPVGQDAAPALYRGNPDDPLMVLDLAPAAAWIVERYPHEEVVDLGHGRLRVTLRASGQAWLERLLLRAGPNAKVVAGDAHIGPDAARRLRSRYVRERRQPQ